jgi:hypothetical protein
MNILSNEPTFDGNGRVVRFTLGNTKSYAALVEDVEAKTPRLTITDESTTLLVEMPGAFRNSILRAARA